MTYKAKSSLAMLKPFQRATVDTVFSRFFTDSVPTSRFLVADEAGLGKTMVARGVVARMVERLHHEKDTVTVVYLCSSQAIAAQNLKSLKVIDADEDAQKTPTTGLLNTRPTLLALNTAARGNRLVNLLSLTPGTALDLRSSGGTKEERALIYAMLRDRIGPRRTSALRFFRGGAGEESWPGFVSWRRKEFPHCANHAAEFNEAVSDDIINLIRESASFRQGNPDPDYPDHLRPAPIIRDLRRLLAQIGLRRLAPDLVIIDEFQRFADLLHDHDSDTHPVKAEAAELARMLFASNAPGGVPPRVLLLSATPYRMVTLKSDAEEEGDHYADFIRTLGFLYDEPENGPRSVALKADLRAFRAAMQGLPGTASAAMTAKTRIETALRAVMSRTERVTATKARDAMVRESRQTVTLQKEDLEEVRAVAHVADELEAPGIVEYWKSSPYLLSFMRGYKMNRLLDTALDTPSLGLHDALKRAKRFTVPDTKITGYDALAPRNGRMRALQDIVMAKGLARALWLPPCRPSFGEAQDATKTLVFSDWSMVPDSIATLLSHEATRQMGVEKDRKNPPTTQTDALLPVLYPCITLARDIDPLIIEGAQDKAASLKAWRRQVRDALQDAMDSHGIDEIVPTGRLVSLRLDDACSQHVNWKKEAVEIDDARDRTLKEAAYTIHDATDQSPSRVERSTVPFDLLTDIALGSPATCALRSLMRVAPDLCPSTPALSVAALRIALAFRSLFDQPESRHLLGDGKDPYWRRILDWCASHDLPAVLDEYVHLLNDAHAATTCDIARINLIAESIADAVSLRPAEITLNRLSVREDPTLDTRRKKARFAMRFAADAENDKGIKRTGLVQAAFKSPFRPFVLATTSIGQEGLDFHSYCARVVHWNLPRNPVDIEQREGRVHRYKNHCVRRNLAAVRGDQPFKKSSDPWHLMFETARQAEESEGRAGDLVPFWMHDGDARIERIALLPPMSREVERYDRLMRSLTLYRLAFGQPRQAELLDLLGRVQEADQVDLASFQIDLRP